VEKEISKRKRGTDEKKDLLLEKEGRSQAKDDAKIKGSITIK